MECKEFISLIGEFLSGELEGELLAEFRRHLDSCPGKCRVYYLTYRMTVNVYRNLSPAVLPDDSVEKLRALLGKLWKQLPK